MEVNNLTSCNALLVN